MFGRWSSTEFKWHTNLWTRETALSRPRSVMAVGPSARASRAGGRVQSAAYTGGALVAERLRQRGGQGGELGGGLGGYRAFSWAAVASQVQATWEGCGCIQRPGALRLAWGGITSGVSMAGCSSSRDPECLGGVCNAYPLGLHGHDGQDGEARSWHGHPHSPSSPGGSCHAEMLRIQPLYAPNAVLGPCRRGHREVAPKRRSPVTTEVEMSKVTLGYRPAATPRGERGWRGPSWSL